MSNKGRDSRLQSNDYIENEDSIYLDDEDQVKLHSLMQQMRPDVPPQQGTQRGSGWLGLSSRRDGLSTSLHT
eukprot:11879910-Ditylum_brightwellii.AAC.1